MSTASPPPKDDVEAVKDRYFKMFMMDFMEFNLRRVVYDNQGYCADQCKTFENLDKPADSACFEKCIGKFTDSYDHSLAVITEYLHIQNSLKPESRGENRYLLGEGTSDPVYDTPLRKRL